MTRADKRFLQGFRRLTGREPDSTEWHWWWHSPASDGTPESDRACQEWTLRMQDTLTLQGR